MKITRLRCCLLVNPHGLDRPQPELSWELAEARPGHSLQSAWRVIVASTRKGALEGKGDLWDTGRVAGSTSCYFQYAGVPLQSRQQCFWRVSAWDESGDEIISEVALWTMGLLSESEWKGYWIGRDTVMEHPAAPFGEARWIWAGEAVPGTVTLETRFERTADQPEHGLLFALADDEAEISLNGNPIAQASRAQGDSNLFPLPHPVGVSGIRLGTNVLSVTARKRHDRDPHAGVIVRLCLGGQEEIKTRKEFGHEFVTRRWVGVADVFTDATWTCRSHGESVREIGIYGVAPWHLQTPLEYPNLSARYVRKSFEVKGAIRRAVLYFSGLGLSEAYLNGLRVGDEVLAPHATDYSARVFYRAFDVSAGLQAGGNHLGCILGNGRFFAPRGRVPFLMENYGAPKLLLQLEIDYADGTTQTVVTDSSWEISTEGPVRWNNEFDGEVTDARRDVADWARAGATDWKWEPVQLVGAPLGRLEAPATEPIRVAEVIPVAKSWQTKYGTTIYDFGVNLVGWCRARVSGQENDTVRLHHAETLDGPDALSTENLRSAQCLDTLHLGKDLTTFEPKFTYHGFRYVEVRGEKNQPTIEGMEACFVHDDVETTGGFSCSDDLVNRIVDAAARGIIGNYRSMPTDCPQRDERMGWLGDRGGGAAGEMFLFDVQKHYRKWLADIRLAQAPNGCLPDIAPPFWRMYSDNVTWPSCFVFITHWLHQHYGDEAVVRENFAAIARWVEHMSGYLENDLLARDVYGDWCVPPESRHVILSDRSDRKTSPVILASSYLAHVLRLAAGFARIVGHTGHVEAWEARCSAIGRALYRKFYDLQSGHYDNGAQTAVLLPLAFDLMPSSDRATAFDFLVSRIKENGRAELGTGLIGGQWLLRTLTANGRPDIARELVTREEYPGWGYMIRQGATTIWELWNGNTADPLMNSGNHVMLLGDLVAWLFSDVAGIQSASPGFSHILFRPHFVFRSVSCKHHTIRGVASSAWNFSQGRITWQVTVPPNTTASASLPLSTKPTLRLNGLPPDNPETCSSSDRFVVPLSPGTHEFEFAWDELIQS